MKLGPVTKLYKRNKTNLKKFDDDAVSAICDVIAIFLNYGQFGAIRTPDSGHMVCKSYIFINSNFYHTKTESKTKKSLTQFSHYRFK